MKEHDSIVDKYVLNFRESVRGLTVGAPIDFRGIVVGEVSAIKTHFDPATKEFSIPVEVSIFPERLISPDDAGGAVGAISSERKEFADSLVKKGLRAQLRTASLLTGQLYVAIDFFPSASKATVDWSKATPQLPTVPGNLQGLQESITSLVAKLNRIPFEGIGNDLRKTLNDADKLMNTINTDVAPEAKAMLTTAREALTVGESRVAKRFAIAAKHGGDHARTVADRGLVPHAGGVSPTPSRGNSSVARPRTGNEQISDVTFDTDLADAFRGCAASPESKFYTLNPIQAAGQAPGFNAVSIAIDPVTIPELVDRPQIVTRLDANRVSINEFARWAEPLKSQISGVLAADLAQRIPEAIISSYPQPVDENAYRVSVDVQRFDSSADGAAMLT